jgi:hypothetical protein
MLNEVFQHIDHVVAGTRFQVPPGDLKSNEAEAVLAIPSPSTQAMPRAPFTFGTIARSIEPVSVQEIIPYDGIPDYREPTTAEHPIIVVTPRGKFCIEGLNLVRDALSDEMKEILCEIEVMEEHSDVELSLRKAASRIATRGGLASYSEIVRNVNAAKKQLESSGSDLRVFGHGGRRFGQGFMNDSHENVKHVLALRFTRSPKTITNYLCHGEDLSDEVFDRCVELDVPKKYYEKYRTQKQGFIKELKKKGLSNSERQEQVSARMLEYLAEYLSGQGDLEEGSQQEQPDMPAPQSRTPESPASAPGSQGNAPLQATHRDEEEHEDAASESEDGDTEAPAQLANDSEEESDGEFLEPEEDEEAIEDLASSGHEGEDEGVISDEEGEDPEPSERPQAMEMEDVHEAILAVAERLEDLPDLGLSRVELVESIREEIDALNHLVRQLEQMEE